MKSGATAPREGGCWVLTAYCLLLIENEDKHEDDDGLLTADSCLQPAFTD